MVKYKKFCNNIALAIHMKTNKNKQDLHAHKMKNIMRICVNNLKDFRYNCKAYKIRVFKKLINVTSI